MKVKNVVQVGLSVPIQVQLHDGAEDKNVKVLVLDPVGKLLTRLTLVAGMNGLYYTNFFQMPDLEFVTVQAHVLENDSNGQPYAIVSERFYAAPKPTPSEKIFKGTIIYSGNVEKILKGVHRETSIVD